MRMKGDGMVKDGNVVHGVSACVVPANAETVPEELTSFTAQASCGEICSPVEDIQGLKHEATPVVERQSTKEVAKDTSDNLYSESEVFDGNELGHPACGSLMTVKFPLCTDFKQLNLSLQNTLTPKKAHLIKQIFGKYGDITEGSILKSIEAKRAFLQLVAEVLELLDTHSVDTIGSNEIQVIQKWTDDAAAVGFHVEWLQHRIKKIVTISKYQHCLMRLNEISERVNAAKIALWEMELQQMILKEDADSMKTEMDRQDLCRSNLCEGLF
ncbi:hypothetical protein CDL12_05370 [Handroanthus impetiginosus]|uniref:Uncharacterized protein n=1 Tax=Handroanthus impetiginosus TaxID=429701 RepID=A0A2G9HWM1_9LAMI|nr:hypothetical protein CDL12_05370 [Handroanthus impetiginosus]